jgi:hypothetical protein
MYRAVSTAVKDDAAVIAAYLICSTASSALRNDVAHGSFNRRTTFREVRLYRIPIYRLVTKIEEYQDAVAERD